MRFLIDIGVQKTGSKARQAFFLNELRERSEGLAMYPAAGRSNGWHQPLFDALQAGDDGLLLQVAREAASSGCECAVLSYEGMHALDAASIRRLAAVLTDLQVVLFVRRQDEFINSLHNQLHKAHRRGLPAIEEFERRMFEVDPRCDYAAIVRRWEAGVGAGRVTPVTYCRRPSSVAEFLRAAGLPACAPPLTQYHNVAIDGFGLAVLREVKAMVRAPEALPRVIELAHRALRPHFLSGSDAPIHWTLSPAQRQRIMALYATSNEWLRRRYFAAADALFPASEPGAVAPVDGDRARDLAASIVAEAHGNAPECC